MPAEPGYIYVLINPSYPGMVKIGLTTRDPESRLDELSRATGVPTPFILIHKEYFMNCHLAEKRIHTILESKGERVSNNREFFTTAIHEAIALIQNVRTKESDYGFSNNEEARAQLGGISTVTENLIEKGDRLYYGEGNEIQDYTEAMDWYRKAAKLGSGEAHIKIGNMYRYGEGVKTDISKAVQWYLEGSRLNHFESFGALGMIYADKSMRNYYNKENAVKSWNLFFTKSSVSGFVNWLYIEEYLKFYLDNEWELSHADLILIWKDKVLASSKRKVQTYSSMAGHELNVQKYRKVINFLNVLKAINDGDIVDFFQVSEYGVLGVSVNAKEIKVGDCIKIYCAIHEPVKANVLNIENDRKFTKSASHGDSIRLILEGDPSNYMHLAGISGAYIVLDN